MKITGGKYWDRPWSCVDGCTPCSPGCDHCWSMAMGKRFHKWPEKVTCRWDRLEIPRKVKKNYVWSIWNDLFHEAVTPDFVCEAFRVIHSCPDDTFLILTKRPQNINPKHFELFQYPNVYLGLTICNQPEADEKLPIFSQIPGKKFLSLEPMLSTIDLRPTHLPSGVTDPYWLLRCIDAVILGGETGPGARPMHPDWVRKVRDDCQAAGVNFFLKQMDGKHNRLLDGREHNDLAWRKG